MNLNQKNWGCPKKHLARQETIIALYRKIFDRKSIPHNRQYWTLSGQCSTGDGNIIPGCEYEHVIQSKLVKSIQFHGVEIVKEIYDANQTISGPNWHLGDFYRTMVGQDNAGDFNPAIVNADLIVMPDNGAGYLSMIVAFLSAIKVRNVMVVGNLILRQRGIKSNNHRLIHCLTEDQRMKVAFEKGWKIYPEGYVYNGTGGNQTVMGTIVLYRK